MPNGGHNLTDEDRARGRETQRRNRDTQRELAQAILDAKGEALIGALVARGLGGSDSLLKEAIHQWIGRPVQERQVSGDQERPVRIVVESAFGPRDGSRDETAGAGGA